MTSMKDIAKVCGVSVATVSKALNDQADIGIATRNKIKTCAKEMGYFPNSQARALRTNRSFNIGVLFADEGQSGLTHDFFSKVLDSFKREVEEQGYDITFINCSKKRKERMTYVEHTKYRGFDGVVIACIDFQDHDVVELLNSDIPIVTIDYSYNNRSSVISNNYKNMKALVEYIVSCGHKDIAYICGEDTAVTKNRLAAFYKVLENNNIAVSDDNILHGAYRNIKKTEELTKQLLNREKLPSCIICSDDYSAMGAINAINEKELKIPDDISIAGYDGISIVSQLKPRLTTILQDTEAIGRKAADKLIALMEKPKTTVEETIMIDGKLVEGKSVRVL